MRDRMEKSDRAIAEADDINIFQRIVVVLNGLFCSLVLRIRRDLYFTLSIVKLSHPERASEARNAVPPSSGYKLGVTTRG